MGRELSPESLVALAVGITFFLVVSVIATLIFARKLETRLIVLGLFLGVASVLYGTMPGPAVDVRPGFNVENSAGQLRLPSLSVTGQTAADSLMKIAFIFVLSGIGFALLARWDHPLPPDAGEKGIHVNP